MPSSQGRAVSIFTVFPARSCWKEYQPMLLPVTFSRLLLFKNGFYRNCFSNSVVEKNYSQIALYMKPPEEIQVTGELFPVISLHSVDWTVGWCLYHVKASSQSWEALEDISILVLARFRGYCAGSIVGSQFDIPPR